MTAPNVIAVNVDPLIADSVKQIQGVIDSYADQLAAAQLNLTAAQTEKAADDQTISGLTGQVATLTAELADATTAENDDAQTIAGLRAQLAAYTGDTLNGFTVGAIPNTNNTSDSLATVTTALRTALGQLGRGVKFFDGGKGWQTAVNALLSTDYGTRPGEVLPVICSKQHTTASFKAAMDAVLVRFDKVIVVPDQEFDDEERDAKTVAPYRAMVNTVAADRDALGYRGKVYIGSCSNTYAIEDTVNTVATFASMYGGLPLDVLGFDVYDLAWRPPTWDWKSYVGQCKTFANLQGKPWALTEFGVQPSTKAADTIDAAAGRAKAIIDFCRADPTCLWVNYWPQAAGPVTPGLIPLVGTPVGTVITEEMSA